MNVNDTVDYLGDEYIEKVVRFHVKREVDLYTAVETVVIDKNISNGIIIGNSGALKSAVLRNVRREPESYPVKPSDRVYYRIETPMELISLNGWIAPNENGEPFIHMHYGISTVSSDGNEVLAFGGHLEKNSAETWLGVVVSIIVFSNDSLARAYEDQVTRMYDLFY